MALKKISVQIAQCNLCDHEWIPRKAGRPARCPNCQSDRWDQQRKRPPIAEQRAAAQKRRAAQKKADRK
jgi:hypothetical protein